MLAPFDHEKRRAGVGLGVCLGRWWTLYLAGKWQKKPLPNPAQPLGATKLFGAQIGDAPAVPEPAPPPGWRCAFWASRPFVSEPSPHRALGINHPGDGDIRRGSLLSARRCIWTSAETPLHYGDGLIGNALGSKALSPVCSDLLGHLLIDFLCVALPQAKRLAITEQV